MSKCTSFSIVMFRLYHLCKLCYERLGQRQENDVLVGRQRGTAIESEWRLIDLKEMSIFAVRDQL